MPSSFRLIRAQTKFPCDEHRWISEVARTRPWTTRDVTQVFGGYEFMNDYLAGRFYRDAKILEIGPPRAGPSPGGRASS
jgi:hypothetical protein